MGDKRKAGAAEDWSVDDFLGGFEPVTRTVHLCMRGDLIGRIDALDAQLQARREERVGSLSDGTRKIAEEIEALRAEAEEHTRPFVVQAIGDEAWTNLKADHKPTKAQQEEGLRFAPSFQTAAVAACCKTPAVDVDQAAKLKVALTHAQWAELFGACFLANEGEARAPKAGLASAILRRSAPSSTTADPEGSPAASS